MSKNFFAEFFLKDAENVGGALVPTKIEAPAEIFGRPALREVYLLNSDIGSVI